MRGAGGQKADVVYQPSPMPIPRPRLGYFTRLLDDAPAGERYRIVSEQVRLAESLGFHSAWVAQHHFSAEEGGLPSPLVFLAYLAAHTRRIRLGTGVIVLPFEQPIRAAEDVAVLDLLSGGRLELGLGAGGTPSTFVRFGLDPQQRGAIYAQKLAEFRHALRGGDQEVPVYPAVPGLDGRVWQATFSVEGGRRAGAAGDGLMLSRTQPRPAEQPRAGLPDIQQPIVDAYLAALPAGVEPRIMASRTLFVADDEQQARRWTEVGLRRAFLRKEPLGGAPDDDSLAELLRVTDTVAGTPEQVIARLRQDPLLRQASDVVVQVHSVDPPPELVLRSLELTATEVAPAMGFGLEVPLPGGAGEGAQRRTGAGG